MSEVNYYRDARIDPLSQRILVLLDETDKEMTNAEIARELGEGRPNVYYRLDEHLLPAELVVRRDPESDFDDPVYTLSTSGLLWVSDERNELARPKTVTELSEVAYDAQQLAENANERVDKTRKKRWQLKNELEEKIEELKSRSADGVDHQDTVDYHGMQATLQDIEARVSRLEAQIDALDKNIGEVEEGLVEVHQCTHVNAEEIEELNEEVSKARNSFFLLQERIDDLETEIESLQT